MDAALRALIVVPVVVVLDGHVLPFGRRGLGVLGDGLEARPGA